MSDPREGDRTAPLATARQILSRWRSWLAQRTELELMQPEDIAQLARDLAISTSDLKALASRRPDASHLLHERMHVLDVTKTDVEATAPGLMRDLERTCACCTGKRVCERDLVAWPDSPAWGGYCPNAEALTTVRIAKARCPA